MRIGIRLHDVAGTTFRERLGNARAQGFTCAHIALAKAIDPRYALPANLTDAFARQVRDALREAEMTQAVLGCYLNLAHPDPDEALRLQDLYIAHLRVLQGIGQEVLGTETGAPNADYAFEPACHTQAALELFIERLLPIVREAERLNVIVGIEPVYPHIVSTPKRVRQVLDSIGSDHLKVILDPVNLLPEDESISAERIIDEALELLTEDVCVLHVKDRRFQNGQVIFGPAGSGNIPWKGILTRLNRRYPGLCATLENTAPQTAVRARQYVEMCLGEAEE